MNQFTLREMFVSGWPILSILILTSILSISILWDRVMVLRQARMNAQALVDRLIQIIEQHGQPAAIAHCQRLNQPAAIVARAILMSTGNRDAKERVARQALQTQILELERFIPILGTIGSIAPFIGLLGTVIGIIKAFIDIALHSGGGMEVVSGGIAEALITTAVGLFVAIPAVVGYNYCVQVVRRMTGEIDVAMDLLIEKTTREGEGSR